MFGLTRKARRRAGLMLMIAIVGAALTGCAQKASDNLVQRLSYDLTGDGRPETVEGPPSPLPDELREKGTGLRIKDADGRVMLEEKSGVMDVAGVWAVGAKTPLLLVVTGGDATTGYDYQGYLYDSTAGRIQRVSWDGQPTIVGLDLGQDPTDALLVTTRSQQPSGEDQVDTEMWMYVDGQMTLVTP